jgi:hypothetical protein
MTSTYTGTDLLQYCRRRCALDQCIVLPLEFWFSIFCNTNLWRKLNPFSNNWYWPASVLQETLCLRSVWRVLPLEFWFSIFLQYKPVKKVESFLKCNLYGLSACYIHGLFIISTWRLHQVWYPLIVHPENYTGIWSMNIVFLISYCMQSSNDYGIFWGSTRNTSFELY